MPSLPTVILRAPDGTRHTLHAGHLIGRLPSAALRLDDPRISEAHALVSLRGRALKLIGLRRSLGVGRSWVAEVELRPGLKVLLEEDLGVEVVDVTGLDGSLLAIEAEGFKAIELDQPELSVLLDPLQVVAGWKREAAAWIWRGEDRWTAQIANGAPMTLAAGAELTIAAHSLRVVEVPLDRAATRSGGRLHPPLTITIHAMHTEIQVQGRHDVVKLKDNAHAILAAIARESRGGAPAHWTLIARRVWGKRAQRHIDDGLRTTETNWYMNRARLREKLNKAGLPDLVEGEDGDVRLALRPGVDEVVLVGAENAGGSSR